MGEYELGIPLQGLAEFSRRAAAEGAVLLRNEKEVLPFKETDQVAVFGRCQIEYYRSGTGSGGAVNVTYVTNLLDGLRDSGRVQVNEKLAAVYKKWIKENPFDNGGGGWAQEPWSQKEMPLTEELVRQAAEESNKAVIVIGRTAGEDKDNKPEEGSYLLTETEKDMIRKVSNIFENVVVVLNVANIIDMSFLSFVEKPENLKAVIYAWQGGMEGGNAIADVLTGKVTPQGKLADTIAKQITDYPSDRNHGGEDKNIYREDIYVGYRYFETFRKDAVMYPFGYGLSYTSFAIEMGDSYTRQRDGEEEFVFECVVRNIGTKYFGREIVQIYVEGPQNGVGRPARELVGFQKTKLLAGQESEEIEIVIPLAQLAVFDDSGVTGHPNCYVVEKGEYIFHVGNSVRDTRIAQMDGKTSYCVTEEIVVRECEEALAPVEAFERLRTGDRKEDGTYEEKYEEVPLRKIDLRERILNNLPKEYPITGDKGLTLQMVAAGSCSMQDFIAQLTEEELAIIVRGEGMCSIKVTPGTAGAFGGVSDKLLRYGIPIGCCSDGPSGIRMDGGLKATQLPIGTLLACTWDTQLVEELFILEGQEMLRNRIDTLLGPGVNIHRHPLNGRNFEYFSEDPLITGRMAVAVTQGIAKNGVYATVKHFACNSQETRRHMVEAVASQRALREIYLKGFELAVREGNAQSIMTSYNPINGHWAASNYDLNTTILREEWGFTGMVMTDWRSTMNDVIEGGEPSAQKTGDMIRSQNDLFMVVSNNGAEINSHGDDTLEALAEGRLTVGELQRCAMNICNLLMKMPVFARFGKDSVSIPQMAAVEQPEGEQGQSIQKDSRIRLEGITDVWFKVEKEGQYSVLAKIMYDNNSRAQAVCKALLNDEELNTFQINGTNGRWIYQKLLDVKLEKGWYHLTLEFPKPGMQVEYMEFVSAE